MDKLNFLKFLLKIFTVVIFLLVFCGGLSAQPDNPPPVPIDGGISFLIAAGILYGTRLLYKNKKRITVNQKKII